MGWPLHHRVPQEIQQLEYLADNVVPRRAAAKSLKRFYLTSLPHHFPADRSLDALGDIGVRQETLLQVVPAAGQDVYPEDVHWYDDPPSESGA